MALLPEIDVRGLPPDRGAAFAREVLDALAPGQSVVMLSDADPEPVLRRLRSPELDDVLIFPLDNAGGMASVELRRRDGTRSLLELVHFEHERLERLIVDLEWRIAQHRTQDAQIRLEAFSAAVARHVDMLERVVLPRFRRFSGEGDVGVAAHVEDEHAVILALLRRIRTGVPRTDAAYQDALCAVADLRELLATHARTEEWEICAALPEEEAAKLARELHQMRPL